MGLLRWQVSQHRRKFCYLMPVKFGWGVSHRTHSLPNGQYLLRGLNPAKRYLIMARDYQGEYEPYCYDHVAPATDLTLDEQQALWQQMVNQASKASQT